MFIKKIEFKNIVSDLLAKKFEPLGFKHIKSQNKFSKEIAGGIVYFTYQIKDNFNRLSNQVSWQVEIYYFIRYNVVHKWFEQFEMRKKSDYKDSWTIGVNKHEISNNIFSVDVDDKNVIEKVTSFVQDVYLSFGNFLHDFNSLSKINDYLMPKKVERIEDFPNYKNFNFNFSIICLSIARILHRNDFDNIVTISEKKLLQLVQVGDPMAINYFPNFNKIVETLKQTDFSNSIVSVDSNVN